MSNRLHCCCFFGHRNITETAILKKTIYDVVEDLIINKNVSTFFFGSKSAFDKLCHKIVTELKEKYPHIVRVYVRAEFPFINDSYRNYLLKQYEDTYYPEKMISAGRAAYVERNYEMISKSAYCVIYYDENYAPPKRKNSKKDITIYQPESGTKIAYNYAIKKSNVVNVKNRVSL